MAIKIKTEESGFYNWITEEGSKKSKPIPNYGDLLLRFDDDHPHITVADMKTVYVFRETHYKEFTPIEIKAFAERKFRPHPKETIRAEFCAKVFANSVVTREFFARTTEGKINFQNGVLDMDALDCSGTAELIKHSPEFGFRHVLPFAVDQTATCPNFERWIDDIMLGRTALVAILQEFMGYIVRSGEYKYHKALWLSGTGRNGKSTLLDVLKNLIGDDNYSVLSIKELVEEKFLRAELDGRIANFSEETGPDDLQDTGSFKNLTGDGQLEAQKKYGQPFKFRNRAKMVMTFNDTPLLKDLSTGMCSRLIIIPCEKDLSADTDQDKGLKKKLFAELPGIFNWALKGWARLEEQGAFTVAAESSEALDDLKLASCSVAQWAKKSLMLMPIGEASYVRPLTAEELYASYCKFEGKYSYHSKKFFMRFAGLSGMRERRQRTGNTAEYHALCFKNSSDNQSQASGPVPPLSYQENFADLDY